MAGDDDGQSRRAAGLAIQLMGARAAYAAATVIWAAWKADPALRREYDLTRSDYEACRDVYHETLRALDDAIREEWRTKREGGRS